MKEKGLFYISILLIIALVVVVFLSNNNSNTNEVSNNNTISVYATGEVDMLPDMGIIELGMETRNENAALATTENADVMNKVVEYIKSLGIEDKDIVTSNYNIYSNYNQFEDENYMEYVVTNTVTISFKDLTLATKLIDGSIMNGANRVNSVRFTLENPQEAYNNALKLAMEEASKKADLMASNLGKKIKSTKSVQETSSYYPVYTDATYSKEMSSTPIESGELKVSASVSIIFEY
jgi:uncharacterized protein YggE